MFTNLDRASSSHLRRREFVAFRIRWTRIVQPRGYDHLHSAVLFGALVGGGRTAPIQEETGAKLDVEDDGTVSIAHTDAAGAEAAKRRVEALTRKCKVGTIYDGKVTSDQGLRRVRRNPARAATACATSANWTTATSAGSRTWCKVGDRDQVKVIAIDDQDRVKLSRKALLPPTEGGRTKAARGGKGPATVARAAVIAAATEAATVAATAVGIGGRGRGPRRDRD